MQDAKRRGRCRAGRRRGSTSRVGAGALVAAVLTGSAPSGATGDTRTLAFFHTHTKESATVTFRTNGQYDREALRQLNWLLRDWRVGEPAAMDPRLFDVLWEIHQEVGSREPIHVISAYRSPVTNGMLRRVSAGVSEHSQHMQGRAMDIRLPDVDAARLRAAAMRLQHGGVGFYPGSGFVHVDTGGVRAWPRMSQDQLARLFPDGKTVHLPTNGKPLARYEEARAEVLARNAGQTASAGRGLGDSIGAALARLFGPRDGGSGATLAAAPSEQVTAYAPGEASPAQPNPMLAPLPPRRPAQPAVDVAAGPPAAGSDPDMDPAAEAVVGFGADDRAAVRALFAPRPDNVASFREPRLAVARVWADPRLPGLPATSPGATLVSAGFSRDPWPEPGSSRFTGSAVAPLGGHGLVRADI